MSGPEGQRKGAERINEVGRYNGQRISERGRYQLQCFENFWSEWFFTHHDRAGKDDVPAVDAKKSLGEVNDKLESFLESPDGWGSSCEVDEVKWYCGDIRLESFRDDKGDAAMRLGGWVDDRNSLDLTGSGNARLCESDMTARGLWEHLKQSRYNNGDDPDAERRLIYIADITPEFILALAVTTPFLQAPALRDAICKHVSSRPSIRINVPSDGMPTFQMEFHLPFFPLRKISLSDGSTLRSSGKRLRDSEDLCLLTRDKTEQEGQENYRLYEAHMSCVVHGFDEWQWTTWAFEDTEHDAEESTGVDDGPGPAAAEPVFCPTINEDPIACGLDANMPIWRPRQYFLKAFEIRIQKVRDEWDELVHRLEVDKREYIKLHPFSSSKSSRNINGRAEEMNRRFDWTRRRSDLLIKLLCALSGIIREWNTFISSDGDVGYLSDLDEIPTSSRAFHQSGHAGKSLRSINQAFGRLEEDRQRLIALKEWFSNDFTTLKLFLSLEGNDATVNSAFLSKFTIWVLCPCSLAAGFFSMQPTVIPVDLTFRWFLILVLILMGIMVVIQWVMMRWSGWRDQFLLWLKLKRMEEEESGRGLRSEYENNSVPDFHHYRTETDLESLGTRALSGRRMYYGAS